MHLWVLYTCPHALHPHLPTSIHTHTHTHTHATKWNMHVCLGMRLYLPWVKAVAYLLSLLSSPCWSVVDHEVLEEQLKELVPTTDGNLLTTILDCFFKPFIPKEMSLYRVCVCEYIIQNFRWIFFRLFRMSVYSCYWCWFKWCRTACVMRLTCACTCTLNPVLTTYIL